MNKKRVLDAYIASRFIKIEESAALQDHYKDYVAHLVMEFINFLVDKRLLADRLKVDVEHVFALNKTSCALHFGDTQVVVVNRYFIQTLNNLNKILNHELESKVNSLPMFYYLFRLAEEEAYVAGYPVFGTFIRTFRQSQALKEIEAVWRKPTNILHTIQTSVQEAFVIAHELSHVLHARGMLIDDRAHALFEPTAQSSDGTDRPDEKSANHSRAGLDLLTPDTDDVAEESACDRLALAFVHGHFSDKQSYTDTFLATRLFFMHMRTIRELQSVLTNPLHSSRLQESSTFRELPHHFRRSMMARGPLATNDADIMKHLNAWNDLGDLYHDRITKIVFNSLHRLDKRIWVAHLMYETDTQKFAIERPPPME